MAEKNKHKKLSENNVKNKKTKEKYRRREISIKRAQGTRRRLRDF